MSSAFRGEWQSDIYTSNPGKTFQRFPYDTDVYNKEKGSHSISALVLNLYVLEGNLVPIGAGSRAGTFLPREPAAQRRGQAHAAPLRFLSFEWLYKATARCHTARYFSHTHNLVKVTSQPPRTRKEDASSCTAPANSTPSAPPRTCAFLFRRTLSPHLSVDVGIGHPANVIPSGM